MGHSMGLTAEQVRWAQHNLTPGLFIGQVGEGPWRYPFVFGVPQGQFTRNQANPAKENPQAMADLPALPA